MISSQATNMKHYYPRNRSNASHQRRPTQSSLHKSPHAVRVDSLNSSLIDAISVGNADDLTKKIKGEEGEPKPKSFLSFFLYKNLKRRFTESINALKNINQEEG